MKKKLGLTLAAGLMCAAMLAGCGGSSSETEPQTIGEPTSAAEESAQETAAAEPTGAQELTFVLNNEPDSLDPSYTNNSFASPFLANLFEGLVTYDENGELEVSLNLYSVLFFLTIIFFKTCLSGICTQKSSHFLSSYSRF